MKMTVGDKTDHEKQSANSFTQGGLDRKEGDETLPLSSVAQLSKNNPIFHYDDDQDQLRSFGPLRLRDSARDIDTSSLTRSGMTEAAMLKQLEEENQLLRRRKEKFTDEDLKSIPRMVPRNLPFHQSRNDIAVFKMMSTFSPRLKSFFYYDWYHIVLRWPTRLSILILLLIWTIAILIFAFIYIWIDKPGTVCGLGEEVKRIGFSTAFAFSVETCTTVGYGLPNGTNSFFEKGCGSLVFFIYLQMVFSMMFNAFLFAFMFSRLSRCESRSVQVLFSNKAILEIQDGKWYLHVRVFDMDSAQPIIESHIRMYCVSWRDYEEQIKEEIQPHLLHHMRLLTPNDELGSMMYPSVPSNITHHIDAFSPLTPPEFRQNRVNVRYMNDMDLREVDEMTGNRSDILCTVCGETFGVREHLEQHIRYMKTIENADERLPVIGTHRDPNLVISDHKEPIVLTIDDLKEHLADKEVMCVVEAIEPIVSGNFQAVHSYRLEDIAFGGQFAPCMSQKDGKIYVDVDKFHKVREPSDSSMHYYNSRGSFVIK